MRFAAFSIAASATVSDDWAPPSASTSRLRKGPALAVRISSSGDDGNCSSCSRPVTFQPHPPTSIVWAAEFFTARQSKRLNSIGVASG